MIETINTIATINQLERKITTCKIAKEQVAEAKTIEQESLADLVSFAQRKFPKLYERIGFPQSLEDVAGLIPILKEANGVKEND